MWLSGNGVFALASASTPVVFFFMWLVVLVFHRSPPSLSLGGQTTNRIFNYTGDILYHDSSGYSWLTSLLGGVIPRSCSMASNVSSVEWDSFIFPNPLSLLRWLS